MANTGAKTYTTSGNYGSASIAWTSVSGVSASDSSGIGDLYITNTVTASNFGFSIPSGATIDGIQIDLTAYATYKYTTGINSPNKAAITKVVCYDGSSEVGTSNAPGILNTSPTLYTYGGATNTLTTGLTAAQLNSSSFAIAMSGYFDLKANASNDINVSSLTVTVYYTEPGGGGSSSSSKSGMFLVF